MATIERVTRDAKLRSTLWSHLCKQTYHISNGGKQEFYLRRISSYELVSNKDVEIYFQDLSYKDYAGLEMAYDYHFLVLGYDCPYKQTLQFVKSAFFEHDCYVNCAPHDSHSMPKIHKQHHGLVIVFETYILESYQVALQYLEHIRKELHICQVPALLVAISDANSATPIVTRVMIEGMATEFGVECVQVLQGNSVPQQDVEKYAKKCAQFSTFARGILHYSPKFLQYLPATQHALQEKKVEKKRKKCILQ